MSRRWLRIALLSALVGVVAVVATVVAIGIGGSGQAAPSRSALPPATATVTTATLVEHTEVGGTLGYGDPVELTARGAGTVTWLPDAGAVIERGGTLYKIDELPVTLLYGPLPAYRRLAVDTEGADVRQFEENLAALGYTGFTVDDSYSARTAEAVRSWQEDLDREQTGEVDPSHLVYAAGPIRVAELAARAGDAPNGPLLRYTGTGRTVTVDLNVDDQRLAVAGAPVTVTLPGGATVAGTVASVGTTATESDSSQGADGPGGGGSDDATIEVVIAVADQSALGTLDRAPVRVELVAGERKDVLTVPVAALLALREGGYGVEVVDVVEDQTSSRIVRVEVGMFADGRVEISGAGIAEGTTVGVPK